jgi:hypothetical protein
VPHKFVPGAGRGTIFVCTGVHFLFVAEHSNGILAQAPRDETCI